ncbi:TlyA family RNA methyltransferase [Gloeobacter morelensis]|uniref:TlyA family RNA methyltransferase n=1 Tax=Gloeobacter morelensis MG652769 TaxID=2781736 RepID=A0ABY3PR57_9CYAN|nr:TlyA family RNA methyltransferase [Gloeobacter morelensis]UFP96129.1 TlyA family RNA methyltransferase [Gloeobacter morelensis MG652769]
MAERPARLRLDQILVERGLAESRQKAQALIRAGQVRVGGERFDKPGSLCPVDSEVSVAAGSPFVSRGGEKLKGALARFDVQIEGRVCLDGGISTGGFTDCLLQRGAARVYGIDVGYGQVAWKLRTDPRVVLKERTNLRYLTSAELYGPGDPWPDLATADVSFISLKLVLAPLWQLLLPPREVLLLVKPQFEAGREHVGKNGVVRDPAVHREVIAAVWQAAQALGWGYRGLCPSPIAGPAGNHEYWLWLSMEAGQSLTPEMIGAVVHAVKAER